jgi:serine/threonine protein kinase
MELCEAESLESIIANGPLDFEKAKSIVVQVGQALLEAQKAGLVHRAVAPQNVLITASGDVKLINFPIAKPINEKVAGVAAYVAPEQIQGKPIDQRSNTYSLAAVLYHLCTGEMPFQAAEETALLEMHLSSPLLPPTQRRPGGDLPTNLDKLILKAMDKSSSRRHLTLRLFLTELETLKATPYLTPSKEAPTKHTPLAKTMMFAGNQSDVARIVAEAKAGKTSTSPVPATVEAPISQNQPISHPVQQPAPKPAIQPAAQPAIQPAPQPAIQPAPLPAIQPAPQSAPQPAAPKPVIQPAPQPVNEQPTHVPAEPAKQALGIMQTMVASASSPAPSSSSSIAELPETPVPKTPSISPASVQSIKESSPKPATTVAETSQPASTSKAASSSKAGAAFRETLWFKKGDVEQMVADAKAKMQSAGNPEIEASTEVPEDSRALEDRYVDDGSVTTEDRKKFSLRTGATATTLPVAATSIPGERINEQQMVGEIDKGRRTLILTIAIVIILAVVVVIVMMMKGKGNFGSHEPSSPPPNPTTATPTPSVPVIPAASPIPHSDPVPEQKAGSEPTPAKPAIVESDSKNPSKAGGAESQTSANKKAAAKKRAAKRHKKARQ